MSKTLIHDLDDDFENKISPSPDLQIINAKRAYASCTGCYGCWLHTPGLCTMRDKLHRTGADIANADEVFIISQCVYGGLSPAVKKVWDRCIPAILPFFSLREKRMHHARRYLHEPNITAVFYGEVTAEEQALAQQIIIGNGINFCAKNTKILFWENPNQILLELGI